MKPEKSIAEVGEFELIQTCFSPLSKKYVAGIAVGIGDDGAVLDIPTNHELVVSSDTLVEGIHFSSNADPYLLGRKALRVNLSDLAAMGATPGWYLLSLSLPQSTLYSWVTEFSRGLKEDGEGFNVVLTGGDTTGSLGGIMINITVMGHMEKGRAILRSGSKPGDKIFVTGTLGDSALGLALNLGKLKISSGDDGAYLLRRHQLPDPQIALGMSLASSSLANGAIDLSDGLVADLKHLCAASKVGAGSGCRQNSHIQSSRPSIASLWI